MCMGRIIVMHIHSDLGAAWLEAFFSVLMKMLFRMNNGLQTEEPLKPIFVSELRRYSLHLEYVSEF